jgi:hypothetical protein
VFYRKELRSRNVQKPMVLPFIQKSYLKGKIKSRD